MRRIGGSYEIWIISAGWLIISTFGWLKLQQAVVYWDWLYQINLQVPPLYLAIYGGAIGVAGLLGALSLLFRWSGAVLYNRAVTVLLISWFWLDRLVLTQSAAGRVNDSCLAGLSILWIALVFIILAAPKTRAYFE